MNHFKEHNGVLHLFTTRYPYGIAEPFLENELPYLCAYFEEVIIYPMFKESSVRGLPVGATVVDLFDDPFKPASFGNLVLNFNLLNNTLQRERKRATLRNNKVEWPELRSSLRQNLERALVLKSHLGKGTKRDLFYSYWTFDWATVLSLLVRMKVIGGFVSRVHGFDLYEGRSKKGFIPFRELQLANVSKLIAVSEDGFNYLNRKYKEYNSKFHLSQLGVGDNGLGPYKVNSIPHIVSCSYVIPLKRVEMILQALIAWDKPVLWTHFGDGIDLYKLKELVSQLPGHISVELKGLVKNSDVLAHYKANVVDLFMHLSSSEGGVSVAMQEAASFGVPLMGAAVGGVPEICNEETGILLNADPSIEEVVVGLDLFFSERTDRAGLRGKARAFWKEHFDAAKVFPLFCQLLAAR